MTHAAQGSGRTRADHAGTVPVVSDRPKARRRLTIAAVGLVGWAAILLFAWALRPIDDTVPVVLDPGGRYGVADEVERARAVAEHPPNQLVRCQTLFDADARDPAEPLPALADGFAYARPPCVEEHTGARLAFGLNALIVALGLAAVAALAVRLRSAPTPPGDTAASGRSTTVEPTPATGPTTSSS